MQEVLVKISALHGADSPQGGPMELVTKGTYFQKNGKHYITYDEMLSDEKKITKNLVKISDDSVEITKKGEVSVNMLFEKDKKNLSFYELPFGNMLIGVQAEKLEFRQSEDGLLVDMDYELEIDEKYVSQCQMKMEIKIPCRP